MYQSEVKSAPRSRASITLFTAAVFYQSNNKTYLVRSNTKDKDKNVVFTFVTKLYDQIMIDVPKVSPQVNDVILSDGPSDEFNPIDPRASASACHRGSHSARQSPLGEPLLLNSQAINR